MCDQNVTFFFLLAVCDQECLNGGVCSEPNVCDCPPGYIDDLCETRMLQNAYCFKLSTVNEKFFELKRDIL